jgi:sensor histidine kinase YesM
MINQKLDIVAPRLKEAGLISFVLIFAIASILTVMNVLTGNVSKFSDILIVLFGFTSAVLFALILLLALRVAAGRPLWLAVPLLLVSLTATAMLQTGTDFAFNHLVRLFFPAHLLPEESLPNVVIVFSFYWIQYACIMALLCVAAASRKIRRREVELAHAQAAQLQAELNMLRMQINPHFMCNSLNVISGLILGERHGEAQKMADKLAGFLRAATEIEGMETGLGEELEMIDAYLGVEASRFGERLRVEIEHDPALEQAAIPTFILQPLVENALKYGVHMSTGRVELRVRADREDDMLVLTVENEAEMPPATPLPKRTGVGLSNVRSRLELLFGGAADFEAEHLATGYRATIRMPYREIEEASEGLKRAAGQ